MPRQVVPLTATRIKNAKPGDFPLWDGQGLHLIYRSGGLHWRLKYVRPDGRDNRLALGRYPAVSLHDARELGEAARNKLAHGIDPAADRKARHDDAVRARHDTFGHFAEQWLAAKGPGWAEQTREKMALVVRGYLVPAVGKRSAHDLASSDVLRVLIKLHAHAPSLVPKAAQAAQAIVRVAISAGAREDGRLLDLNLRDNLPAPEKHHYPAAIVPADLREVLAAIVAYPSQVTRDALLVCAYTAQRPGCIAAMEWSEISGTEWRIPEGKMKGEHAHMVPLSRQVLTLLDDMRQFTAGRQYVFPPLARQRNQHVHRDALSKAMREDMGLRGKQTPHGLRATLRTMAREYLGVAADVLEAQLAHVKKGEVQAAYDRTRFDDERRKMVQRWADYIDKIAAGRSAQTP